MNTNYPALSESVNPQPHPEPGYYAVIPSRLLEHEKLSAAAKLFYGLISSLCNSSGYCWATNDWFVDRCHVDETTIRRSIAALAKAKFIRVEREVGTSYRRIYLAEVPSPDLAQKCPNPRAKMPEPSRKNARHSIKERNTKSIQTLNVVGGGRSRFVEPGPLPAREVQKQQQEQDEKGQAALASRNKPASPFLESWKEPKINAVVAATDDEASRKRFIQLLDICDGAACVPLWDAALDALKHARGRSTGLVARPGAYFCSVLVSALNARGVAVPVGKPSERRLVRGLVAASLVAADVAVVGGASPDPLALALGGEVA